MRPAYFINICSILCAIAFLGGCQSTQEQAERSEDETIIVEEKVTIADVEQGIRANIEAKTKDGGGYFNFSNDTSDFSLKLVRVHTEYLSVLKSNEFFACVDLATEDGDVYDMDFFLEGTKDDMKVTRTTLHKLNGKPYYTWKQQEDKTWSTVPVKGASNALLGVIEEEDQFRFRYEVTLPELGGSAEMWIPIPQTDAYQTIEIVSMKLPVAEKIIQEEPYGNSILYMELKPEHSGATIAIEYDVVRVEKSAYIETSPDMEQYLEAAPLLPVGDRFGVIADEIIAEQQANTPLTKARAIYDYVTDNMRYAKQGVYGTGDANYACDSKSGNCTEFHSFFISLARSAGIPARFAVGAAIPSARNEGGVDGYHCWAEFYAEGKWWPVDISEANKYAALATYYFGHHPANRIELSRGRNLTPSPMPQSGPINFLAYPVLEVEGEVDFAPTTFTYSRANIGS